MLPAVTPSLGPAAVLAATMRMREAATPNSSQTICASAVAMPWPSSTLPVRTVTVPAGLMASH